MTLHKLQHDPDPDQIGPTTKLRIRFEDGRVVEVDNPTDEQWELQYGHWRYQCDFCGRSYHLKAWPGFGLSVGDASHLSSVDVDVWEKLVAGDAHFCDPECAGG